jgi:hypothetical protein
LVARLTVLLLAMTAAVALAAGCGGGGDATAGVETTVTASSLSKAAFVKKANVVCRREAQRAISYVPLDRGELSYQEAFDKTLEDAMLPAFRRVVDEIRKLGAPQGDEREVEAFLEAFAEAIDQLEENGASSPTGLEIPFASSTKLARAYGIDNCGYKVQ